MQRAATILRPLCSFGLAVRPELPPSLVRFTAAIPLAWRRNWLTTVTCEKFVGAHSTDDLIIAAVGRWLEESMNIWIDLHRTSWRCGRVHQWALTWDWCGRCATPCTVPVLFVRDRGERWALTEGVLAVSTRHAQDKHIVRYVLVAEATDRLADCRPRVRSLANPRAAQAVSREGSGSF